MLVKDEDGVFEEEFNDEDYHRLGHDSESTDVFNFDDEKDFIDENDEGLCFSHH